MSKWTQAQMKKIDDASAAALGKIRQQQNAQGTSLNDRWNLARGKDDRWERSAAARADSSDANAQEHDDAAAAAAAAAPFSVRSRAAQMGAATPAANKGPPPPPPSRPGAGAASSGPPPPPARLHSSEPDSVGAAGPGVVAAAPPPPPPRGFGATSAPSAVAPVSSSVSGPRGAAAGLAAGSAQAAGVKFSNMDAAEKEAFFSLLDEYFQSRGFFQQQ